MVSLWSFQKRTGKVRGVMNTQGIYNFAFRSKKRMLYSPLVPKHGLVGRKSFLFFLPLWADISQYFALIHIYVFVKHNFSLKKTVYLFFIF